MITGSGKVGWSLPMVISVARDGLGGGRSG
jgi:hypothetical protein